MLRSGGDIATHHHPTDKDNVGGFISDCNILARDSMGFVHALLLVNITFVPYRPDIDTGSVDRKEYLHMVGHNNNISAAGKRMDCR